MLVCLGGWALLFAPTMKRAAEASPDGARRTAALVVLSPFVAISDVLQITKLTDGVERALGRDPEEAPGGVIVVPPEPIPTVPGEGTGTRAKARSTPAAPSASPPAGTSCASP